MYSDFFSSAESEACLNEADRGEFLDNKCGNYCYFI
jgi:hypothetical protein